MRAVTDKPVLTVYSREYCHLCHDMIAALREIQQRREFELEIRDVDADPGLEERFDELVPVLMAGDEEICHYFLDVARLDAYLDKTG